MTSSHPSKTPRHVDIQGASHMLEAQVLVGSCPETSVIVASGETYPGEHKQQRCSVATARYVRPDIGRGYVDRWTPVARCNTPSPTSARPVGGMLGRAGRSAPLRRALLAASCSAQAEGFDQLIARRAAERPLCLHARYSVGQRWRKDLRERPGANTTARPCMPMAKRRLHTQTHPRKQMRVSRRALFRACSCRCLQGGFVWDGPALLCPPAAAFGHRCGMLLYHSRKLDGINNIIYSIYNIINSMCWLRSGLVTQHPCRWHGPGGVCGFVSSS